MFVEVVAARSTHNPLVPCSTHGGGTSIDTAQSDLGRFLLASIFFLSNPYVTRFDKLGINDIILVLNTQEFWDNVKFLL